MRCEICHRPSKGLLCSYHAKTHIILKDGTIIKKYSGRMSKKQKYIVKRLINAGIKVLFEVYFPWAKIGNSVRLPFDIVLPEQRVIIEYDGRQHFEYVKFFFKTKKEWKRAVARDRIKEQLAEKNGWRVIRFNYKDNLVDSITVFIEELKKNGQPTQKER